MNFVRLHAGCGCTHLDGFINADLYPSKQTDLVFDLMKPWPIRDDTVQDFYASHTLEHLPDPQFFFKELHRVCMPNAQILLRVPYGGNKMAWADITHIRPWFAESFCWLQPGYFESNFNPQHGNWNAFFGVGLIQLRMSARALPWIRNKWKRKIFCKFLLPGTEGYYVDELWANLFALKKTSAIQEYQKTHKANTVGCTFSMYDFVFRGETQRPDNSQLIDLAEFTAEYGVIP